MISVIIPCYNVSGTLLQCIQSISRQTYRKFEIILINDGSTDNTVEVIQRIKEEFHELLIKVINQENHGVSSARNQGIKSAVGEYISFVDADDYIEPLFFEELLDGYKSDVELSIVGIQKSIDTNKKSSSNKKVVNNSKYFETMFKDPEIKGFPVNRLYKTNIIKENNVYFNESLSILEDLEFNLRYYQFVGTVSISTAPLYHYIIQDSSAMTGQWNEKKITIFETFKVIYSKNWSSSQKLLIDLEYKRMTLWLIGQLYRNGQKDDIVINEKLIFRELDKDKKLFLQKGHIIGMKYYIPYLLYCINRRFLKYIVKI